MLKSTQIIWAVVVAILLASFSAQARQSSDWTRCLNEHRNVSPDVALSSCSNVISSGKGTRSKLAIAYSRRGDAYHDKGEYDRAIADYTKAIEIDPRDTLAYNNRGISHRAKGDHDSAIADYTEAIEIDPRDAVAYNNRGVAHRAKADHDRAIADHTKAIEIDSQFARAFSDRGIAYRAKGDHDRAIADYTRAIEIDPQFARAFNNRAIAYRAKGDHDRAIADHTKAIEINPQFAAAYHDRGLAYRAMGDDDRAIADHAAAIRIDKKYAHDAAVPKSISAGPLSRASIEKAALAPSDAPRPPITLVLKADLGAQQVTVSENHRVVHVWPISSGVRGYATPTGVFQPTWASRMWYSRQYNWTPMPYAVFFTRGVAFHGTTVTSRLGKSASHGCIRLATSHAAQLFKLVHKHGFGQTQIIVFGTARHDPPAVARPAPTVKAATTAPNGFPSWAKDLFYQ